MAASAATLTVKLRAFNPSKAEKQQVEVKAHLPRFAGPDTIIDAGGLEVSYDVGAQAYYVHAKVELDPEQTRTFDVVMKDIWVIPEQRITELGAHARSLAAATAGSEQAETAGKVSVLVEEALKNVAERQRANAIGVAKPVDHIRTYESNMQALEQVRKDLGVLENLVIAAGKDPGQILGAARVKPPNDIAAGGGTDRLVAIRIKITNPSLTEKKAAPLRRELPVEIKTTDIVDSGELKVGFDSGKGVSYVYADPIELPPQQSREFEVKVRNPWAGADERLKELRQRAASLAQLSRDTQSPTSVLADAEQLARDLDLLSTNVPPATMNEDYVAFSRQRADQLRDLQGRAMRLEELFQPNRPPQPEFNAPVLNVKPPSRQTTWRIIWIILIFLGLFSVLFFLRWYGRTKAEVLGRGASGPSARTSGKGTPGTGPSGP